MAWLDTKSSVQTDMSQAEPTRVLPLQLEHSEIERSDLDVEPQLVAILGCECDWKAKRRETVVSKH